jgi:acyl-CoA synthetase (AMP-forming)/AMP-acid ligase II
MIFRSPYPDVVLPDMPLTSFVFRRAEKLGSKPALIDADSGRTLTFAQLDETIRRAAGGLAQQGFRKGDVLGLYAANSPEYVIALHAATSLGGVMTPLSPLATAQEVSRQLADSGAAWLVTGSAQLDRAVEAARRLTMRGMFVLDADDGQDDVRPFDVVLNGPASATPTVAIDPQHDIALLPYSSGTTGMPKGVELTHATVVHNLAQTELLRLVQPDDVMIGLLPLFHAYGQFMLHCALIAGATVVLQARFELESFLRVLQERRVTLAPVVPPVVQALARAPLVDQFDLSALRTVLSAAAPLADGVATACAERVGCRVVQAYGMTESGPAISAFHAYEQPKLGAVGRLLPNTTCKVVDLGTGAALGPGEPGEICVFGPQIMRGYLRQPVATAATIDSDGWLHTGDVGRVDAAGYLYVVDRVKELIKYKGYQVAPAELEAVMLTHPAVADVAVIPSPDEDAGEVPKACVVLRTHVSDAELMTFVGQRVAPYKRVRRVEVLGTLPRSPSGKLLRRVLVERERTALANASHRGQLPISA